MENQNQDRKKELQHKLEEAKRERNKKQKAEKLRLRLELAEMKKKARKKEKEEKKEKKHWWTSDITKQLSSFVVGFFFNWIIGGWTASLVKNWSAQYVAPGYDTVIYWIAFAIFVIYFGYYGIGKLKEFWNGVPTILGRPISWYIIPSGLFWQLPWPWMGFMPVFIGQRDLDIKPDKTLSRDNIEIGIDAQIQARVTEPYKHASVENPDEALKTLSKRNIRILVNTKGYRAMPGQKQQFSRNLEQGVPELPIFDDDGNPAGTEELKSVKEEAAMWGYKDGIDKCMINNITLPEELLKEIIKEEKEQIQTRYEQVQHDLFLVLLGAGDINEGREAFLKMIPEERAKNIQAERDKRTVITIDGNAGDFTKGGVGAAAMKGGGK